VEHARPADSWSYQPQHLLTEWLISGTCWTSR